MFSTGAPGGVEGLATLRTTIVAPVARKAAA